MGLRRDVTRNCAEAVRKAGYDMIVAGDEAEAVEEKGASGSGRVPLYEEEGDYRMGAYASRSSAVHDPHSFPGRGMVVYGRYADCNDGLWQRILRQRFPFPY